MFCDGIVGIAVASSISRDTLYIFDGQSERVILISTSLVVTTPGSFCSVTVSDEAAGRDGSRDCLDERESLRSFLS